MYAVIIFVMVWIRFTPHLYFKTCFHILHNYVHIFLQTFCMNAYPLIKRECKLHTNAVNWKYHRHGQFIPIIHSVIFNGCICLKEKGMPYKNSSLSHSTLTVAILVGKKTPFYTLIIIVHIYFSLYTNSLWMTHRKWNPEISASWLLFPQTGLIL